MNESEIISKGEQGKPGKDAEGVTGGRGGEGGRGGSGKDVGGIGGAGGAGGEAYRGPRGYKGDPGKAAPRRAIIGYVILSIAIVLLSIYAYNSHQKISHICHTIPNLCKK